MTTDYSTIIFTSRNKDNANVPNFKQRNMTFLSDKPIKELIDKFNQFVDDGVVGEMSRFYQSVNKRDIEKANKKLVHYLIDNPTFPPYKIETKLVSLASMKDCATSNKWLFDFDDDDFFKMTNFLEEIKTYTNVEWSYTHSGFAVVAEHGFDTRKLLTDWDNVTLHRDGQLYITSKTKENKHEV